MTDSDREDLIKGILPVVEKRIEEVKPYVREHYLVNLECFAKDFRKDTIRTVLEYPYGNMTLLDSLLEDVEALYLFIFEKGMEEYITAHHIYANTEDIEWIENEKCDYVVPMVYDDIDDESLFDLETDMTIEEAIKHMKDLPDSALFDEFTKGYFHPAETNSNKYN